MLNKYIVPTGITVCIGVFIWAFLSGREQLSVSPKPPVIAVQSVNVTPSVTELIPRPFKVTSPRVDRASDDNEANYFPCKKADYDRAAGLYNPVEAYVLDCIQL